MRNIKLARRIRREVDEIRDALSRLALRNNPNVSHIHDKLQTLEDISKEIKSK